MIKKIRISMRNGTTIVGRVLTENLNQYNEIKADALLIRDFSSNYMGCDITPKQKDGMGRSIRKESVNVQRDKIRLIQTF